MRDAATIPSPLVGEGGRRSLTDEGLRPHPALPDITDKETPHPTSPRSATFSHKGRRTK